MSDKARDITDAVSFGENDDELLPITKCACGATFEHWKVTIGIYEDDPHTMPCCGRRLFFRNKITVYNADG